MLADEGHRLVVSDIDAAGCERIGGQLAARGATVLAVPGDVASRA